MKYLRKFDSVSEMETAAANAQVSFIGLAYDNGTPVIDKVVPPPPPTNLVISCSSNTVTISATNATTLEYKLSPNAEYITYTAPFAITETVTVYAKATNNGGSITGSQECEYIEIQPNNEIWYTSMNNQVITSPSGSKFGDGITVVSNTNNNGKGIIKLSGDATTIGYQAFEGWAYLTSISIPNSVTTISMQAFSTCQQLTSVTIPNGVTSFGQYCFRNCTCLSSLTMPNSLTRIGDSAFSACKHITSITIPSGVISIGGSAFYGCSGLTSVTIPDRVTSIGAGVFYGCTELTSITVDSNNKVYDSRNNCNAIIETATNKLIAGCKNTVIPDTVTSIGYSAFGGCTELTSITIPNGVTSIGKTVFDGCTGLTGSLIIPDNVTTIGNGAFRGCTGLTSITIPNSVTSIGNNAFYNVAHIYYSGTADGSPWGAKAIN